MFAQIVLYGFALPSDMEKLKARLLTEHSIQVNGCRRESNAMLADDDSQIICTLYRVPANIRYDTREATRLQNGARDTILRVTMVKTAIVVDTMKGSVPSDSQRVVPAA